MFVTGGDATTTYITPEWTDWTTGPDVDFAAYSENAISLSTIMSTYFENGLMAVGTVYDSISIDQGKYYSRIARIAYDADELETLISNNIAYEADENYIYYVKSTATSGSITLSGSYTANDHGVEFFDGTEVAPYVTILYGQNLKAKLTNDVLTISQQTLTAAQKTQVQANAGLQDLLNNFLVVEQVDLADNKTLTASQSYSEGFAFTPKSGYTPIGIAGLIIANGSVGGSGCTWVSSNYWRLVNNNGSWSVWLQYRNHYTQSVKIRIYAMILYRKNL